MAGVCSLKMFYHGGKVLCTALSEQQLRCRFILSWSEVTCQCSVPVALSHLVAMGDVFKSECMGVRWIT